MIVSDIVDCRKNYLKVILRKICAKEKKLINEIPLVQIMEYKHGHLFILTANLVLRFCWNTKTVVT